MSQCQQCNANTDDDAKFCSSCGKILNTEEGFFVERPKNKLVKTLKISFSLAFIGAIISCIYQTISLNNIGVNIPLEFYGEIFGQFFAYGVVVLPIIYFLVNY